MSEPTIQFHIVLGRRDEIVHGPDDADLIVTIGRDAVSLDPAVAYMQGKLKAAGHTGLLFDALQSGQIARELAAL